MLIYIFQKKYIFQRHRYIIFTMKSKSYDFIKNTSKSDKLNKTESFAYLYNSSAEKFKLSENPNIDYDDTNEIYVENTTGTKSKKGKKGNKALNKSLPHNFTLSSKITSTPNTSSIKEINVKSTMKEDDIRIGTSNTERTPGVSKKKRNKSVSFIVDENEEVVDKKVKCEEENNPNDQSNKNTSNETQSPKKDKSSKLNKTNDNKNKEKIQNNKDGMDLSDITLDSSIDKKSGKKKKSKQNIMEVPDNILQGVNENKHAINKDNKKSKKKRVKCIEVGTTGVYKALKNDNGSDVVDKKEEQKNNKHKTIQSVTEGEPKSKTRKKNITEGLEKLNIGDNTHTLTDLLDEMTVVDKNKKTKKSKRPKINSENSEPGLEPIEEAKEKVKWTKRKWNKDKKGEITDDNLLTSVIVENLPLKIQTTYRKLLTEHFNKYGQIKMIGPSEVYPGEEKSTSFATTIYFMNEESTTEALNENGSEFEGAVLTVKRPLSATLSTVVVRSHAALGQKDVCAAFACCGRIRSIRPILKGKKSISTVFVEFDSPEDVEKARKTAEDAKIGGKKIYVTKFVVRGRKDVTNACADQNN